MDYNEITLFDAVSGADVETLQQLLNDKASSFDVEEIDEDNRTVLHVAILKENLEIINVLLEHGANIRATSDDDDTCLHLAVETGNEDMVKFALKSIDVNCSNKLERTPLHVAIIKNKYHVAKLLLNRGADPNTRDATGYTPLHEAIKYSRRREYRRVIELLLKRGADPNTKNSNGNSAFHESFHILDEDLLELFLSKGADVSLRNEARNNALHLAASHGTPEIVEKLLEIGMNVNDADSWGRERPVHLVIIHNRHPEETILDIVRLLVENGAELDAIDAADKTPLYYAAQNNYLRTAEYLMSLGANVDGHSGKLPLFAAAEHGHVRVIKYLINQGASVDVKSYTGESVLHFAIKGIRSERLRYDTVKMLLDNGANANETDFINKVSVSQLALETKDSRLFKLLIEYGASVSIKNSLNQSLLHIACQNNLNDTVVDLINVGNEVNQTFCSGESPMSLSVFNNNQEMFMLLLNNGANIDDKIAVSDAAYKGHIDMMKLLIAYGATVDHEHDSSAAKRPTIMYAIRGCQPRMLEYLLDVGFGYDHDTRAADGLLLKDATGVYQLHQTESSERSIHVLIRHIALLSSLDRSILDCATPLMRKMGFAAEYCTRYDDCCAELDAMKREKILDDSSDLTYYDFLAKRDNALVRCLRNERVKVTLEAEAYDELFPRYFGKLKVHCSNGLLRLRMMDEFRAVLEDIFKDVLPSDVICEISEYFNYTDFVHCFDKLTIFNIVKNSCSS